jgi:DNA helicase II / ATP-dependent DNA helicase PcrA
MNIKPILDRLNEEQRRDAESIYGIRRTIAGPGTGKTGTQVAQIANFIANNIDPSSILAMTFTNKAAAETRHRIVKAVGEDGWKVAASTYHTFCRKWILKPNENHDFFKALGYEKGFIILDDSDSLNAMREVKGRLKAGHILMMEALGLTEKSVLKHISSYRADGISLQHQRDLLKAEPNLVADFASLINRYPAAQVDNKSDTYEIFLSEVKEELYRNPALIDPLIISLWRDYEKECASTDGIDFDNQILYSKLLLEADPSIAKRLSNRFSHICLDEFQDSNQCQWDVINLIIEQSLNPNLFIVGDDRQSIYLFRKAKVELMMTFDQLFPDCITNALVKNYRSSSSIIALGNAHAATMTNQIGQGQLVSGLNKSGSQPVYGRFRDGKAEARWVSGQIKLLLDCGEDPKDIAILYRGHKLKDDLVEELTTQNMDYSIVGDLDFFETAEVKSTIATLRALTRERDIYALSKVLDYATVGISPARLKSKHHEIGGLPMEIIKGILLSDKRAANKGSEFYADLMKIIKLSTKIISHSDFLQIALNSSELQQKYRTTPSAKMAVDDIFIQLRAKKLNSFTAGVGQFWEKYIFPSFEKEAEKLVKKKGLDEPSEQISEILNKRIRNSQLVLERICNDLSESLDLTLSDAIDELVLRAENSNNAESSAINLMTNHASKGLEFKHVFVIGAEQEAYIKMEATSEDIDEESRNFYVAITRAADSLSITSAASRYLHGNVVSRDELMFVKNLKPLMDCIEEKSFGYNQSYAPSIQTKKQNPTYNTQPQVIEELDLDAYLANSTPGGF